MSVPSGSERLGPRTHDEWDEYEHDVADAIVAEVMESIRTASCWMENGVELIAEGAVGNTLENVIRGLIVELRMQA